MPPRIFIAFMIISFSIMTFSMGRLSTNPDFPFWAIVAVMTFLTAFVVSIVDAVAKAVNAKQSPVSTRIEISNDKA